MYDHSLRYEGSTNAGEPSVTDKATVAALRRYENDLANLKNLREKEKSSFYANIALQNAKAHEHAVNLKADKRQNQSFVE